MGLNPIGSNRKSRTTLIFPRDSEKTQFKCAISDIAESRRCSPTEAVLELVLEHVASTPQARDIARTMYSSETPRSLDALELVYRELEAVGERSRDTTPLVQRLLDLSLRLGLSVDTTVDEAINLRAHWESVVEALRDAAATSGGVDRRSAARTASQLTATLAAPAAMLSICSHVSILLDSWDVLRGERDAHCVLCSLAHMSVPTRSGIIETGEDRLETMRVIDRYYMSGEEASD